MTIKLCLTKFSRALQWRDFDAPWAVDHFDLSASMEQLSLRVAELADLSQRAARDDDDLYVALSPARELTSWLERAEIDGARTEVTCTPDPVAIGDDEAPTCQATAVAGGVELSWDDVAGVSTWQVRRNESWLATTNQTTYVDTDAAAGDSWQIRYRSGGVRQDIDCG